MRVPECVWLLVSSCCRSPSSQSGSSCGRDGVGAEEADGPGSSTAAPPAGSRLPHRSVCLFSSAAAPPTRRPRPGGSLPPSSRKPDALGPDYCCLGLPTQPGQGRGRGRGPGRPHPAARPHVSAALDGRRTQSSIRRQRAGSGGPGQVQPPGSRTPAGFCSGSLYRLFRLQAE